MTARGTTEKAWVPAFAGMSGGWGCERFKEHPWLAR